MFFEFSPAENTKFQFVKTFKVCTYVQGRGNDFFLGGGLTNKKMKFWQFSKILLYKSWIQGGPAGPTPLHIWYLPYVKALT